MFQKLINSFRFAKNGLKTVWQEEQNFRIEILVSVVVLSMISYANFSLTESVFCIIAIGMVLTAEILNTAVEDLCNKIEPAHDPLIGKIKDIMAGFVLVSVIGAFIIGCLVLYSHFI